MCWHDLIILLRCIPIVCNRLTAAWLIYPGLHGPHSPVICSLAVCTRHWLSTDLIFFQRSLIYPSYSQLCSTLPLCTFHPPQSSWLCCFVLICTSTSISPLFSLSLSLSLFPLYFLVYLSLSANSHVSVSLGDPICSERLYPILVLHSERRWVLLIRDQADAAECPRPVFHTV